jgi:tetratricopeptide (TPR) repeat protein
MFMLEKAVNYHTQSLKLARQHNNKGAMCDNLRDLGSDHLLMGDFQTALQYFEETLELAKAAGIMWYETKSYISLGELYLLLGEDKKAKKYANLGLKYAERLSAKELRIEALWTRARVKAKETPPRESEKLFKAAIDQALEVRHNTLLWQLFLDYSKFLKMQGRFDEMKDARGESKKVLQIISGYFKNMDFKKDFLESPRVKEVLEGIFWSPPGLKRC